MENSQTDYQITIDKASHKKELYREDRFVDITEREDRSDIPLPVWSTLLTNTYLQSWKGIILNKGVTEIGIYPMLIQELRPKTIIEIGALNGGSAVWLADQLEISGIEGDVYAVDIDLGLVDAEALKDKRVQFIEGDCNKLDDVFSAEFLQTLPHPWLVIEDAHVNVKAVVDFFHHNGMQSGDYLIVEDTNAHMWVHWDEYWKDREEMEIGVHKLRDLREWLSHHPEQYLVDTHYLDMYGYNGSKNWNSVLKKK